MFAFSSITLPRVSAAENTSLPMQSLPSCRVFTDANIM